MNDIKNENEDLLDKKVGLVASVALLFELIKQSIELFALESCLVSWISWGLVFAFFVIAMLTKRLNRLVVTKQCQNVSSFLTVASIVSLLLDGLVKNVSNRLNTSVRVIFILIYFAFVLGALLLALSKNKGKQNIYEEEGTKNEN